MNKDDYIENMKEENKNLLCNINILIINNNFIFIINLIFKNNLIKKILKNWILNFKAQRIIIV